MLHGLQHVVDAYHVKEGFLLAREGCVGQIFRRGGGAHGKRHFARGIGDQFFVELVDLLRQPRLERRIDDPLTDFGAGLGQCAHVFDVERSETIGDTLRQRRAAVDAVFKEIAKRLRRGGEPARHANAGSRQLADHFA